MPAKLTQNQIDHLIAVDESSVVDWDTGMVSRFFVPPFQGLGRVTLKRTGKELLISGTPSATALKSLERRGLIRYANSDVAKSAYWFVVTEDGRAEIERLAEAGNIPHYK